MREKEFERDLRLHGIDHERWAWFPQSHTDDPCSEEIATLRRMLYSRYTYAVYNAEFHIVGYVEAQGISRARDVTAKRGERVEFVKLPVLVYPTAEELP